jgi:hypothetical protein
MRHRRSQRPANTLQLRWNASTVGADRVMKPSKFQLSDGHVFNVERDFAKQQVTFMFEEEEPVTNEMARRNKKAAKRAWQRSAKYSTAAVVEVEDWKLECTYDGCTPQEGRGEPNSRPQPLHQYKQFLTFRLKAEG